MSPKVGGAKPVPTGGRMSNAAEFAVTKLDHLINWGRKVINVLCVAMETAAINYGNILK